MDRIERLTPPDGTPQFTGRRLFEESRRWVHWHYQWMVVHDFLKRVGGAVKIGNSTPQLSRKLNTKLTKPLQLLPPGLGTPRRELAVLNLLRARPGACPPASRWPAGWASRP